MEQWTVYDNLAFPLVCRGYDKAFIQSKVNEVAEALEFRKGYYHNLLEN